jgi:hypothetical protein
MLVLAAVLAASRPAFAQPLPAGSPYSAVHAPSAGMFEARAAMPADTQQERRLSAGPIIGLICAIVASSVALGIAFGLRRRIDRIAGPDPDKADDN